MTSMPKENHNKVEISNMVTQNNMKRRQHEPSKWEYQRLAVTRRDIFDDIAQYKRGDKGTSSNVGQYIKDYATGRRRKLLKRLGKLILLCTPQELTVADQYHSLMSKIHSA
jgi:hypothetical protein